jgi:hypothetical protein
MVSTSRPLRPLWSALGLALLATGAQMCGQFPLQGSARLHVERLVDRLVADLHRRVVGELHPQHVTDLLRRPLLADQPIGDERAQRTVHGQLRRLGSSGPVLGPALGGQRSIRVVDVAVTGDLSRDRRMVTTEPSTDLATGQAR